MHRICSSLTPFEVLFFYFGWRCIVSYRDTSSMFFPPFTASTNWWGKFNFQFNEHIPLSYVCYIAISIFRHTVMNLHLFCFSMITSLPLSIVFTNFNPLLGIYLSSPLLDLFWFFFVPCNILVCCFFRFSYAKHSWELGPVCLQGLV